MYISERKDNYKPWDEIKVGPGLNKGYTSKPSGGFHQADTRDYVLPKNVDELRVLSNPKQTIEAIEEIKSRIGPNLHALVNNAGISPSYGDLILS